jgi:RNA polymerase sigma factor (TIGR02999 family)
MSEITLLLQAAGRGEPLASEELLPLVYEELRKLAAARMASESPGQTLQPTALVHEAWLRLVHEGDRTWENRAHFFRAAAQAMRRILVERARHKSTLKCGGSQQRLDIHDLDLAASSPDDRVLLINESLERLEQQDPESAHIVMLKFFAGRRGWHRLSQLRSSPLFPVPDPKAPIGHHLLSPSGLGSQTAHEHRPGMVLRIWLSNTGGVFVRPIRLLAKWANGLPA